MIGLCTFIHKYHHSLYFWSDVIWLLYKYVYDKVICFAVKYSLPLWPYVIITVNASTILNVKLIKIFRQTFGDWHHESARNPDVCSISWATELYFLVYGYGTGLRTGQTWGLTLDDPKCISTSHFGSANRVDVTLRSLPTVLRVCSLRYTGKANLFSLMVPQLNVMSQQLHSQYLQKSDEDRTLPLPPFRSHKNKQNSSRCRLRGFQRCLLCIKASARWLKVKETEW